ncbi:MAG: hypothetical protein KGD74_04060 [Candidatus Lokiarchaeota archaeon]|nr:hypothetical protein [Candidatus Lokiarchaeota archaeon]
MIKNQIIFEKKLHTTRYSNGQLALFVEDYDGEPIAELSIMHDPVELASDEFILKDYSENEELAQEFIDTGLVTPLDRFVLIGAHLCPICKIES